MKKKIPRAERVQLLSAVNKLLAIYEVAEIPHKPMGRAPSPSPARKQPYVLKARTA